MPDLANLPQPPAAAPAASTDLLPMLRPPAPSAALGTPTIPYGAPLGTLAPAILPKSRIIAAGANQGTSAQVTTPIAIVTQALPGGGVALIAMPNATFTLVNASGLAILVYPPASGMVNGLAAAGTINGQTGPFLLAIGAEASFHTDDGVSYFVAS